MKAQLDFTIIQKLLDLSPKTDKGWVKQLNRVKWGDNPEKLEIRLWHYPDGSDIPDKAGKGITLTDEELTKLQGVPLNVQDKLTPEEIRVLNDAVNNA